MKKYYTIIFLLLAFWALWVIPSCEIDYFVPVKKEIPDTISFSADIMPILNKNCNISGCHSTGGYSPNLMKENAYVYLTTFGLIDTDNAESSILFKRLTSTSNPMPPDGNLPSGDIELILAWIKQGAYDN